MKLSCKIKGVVKIDFIKLKVSIQDYNSYENLKKSSNLFKLIVQSERDIENSNIIEQEKMFDILEKKLFT